NLASSGNLPQQAGSPRAPWDRGLAGISGCLETDGGRLGRDLWEGRNPRVDASRSGWYSPRPPKRETERQALIRCILFDLDGTLLDSYEPITESLNAARAAFGLE